MNKYVKKAVKEDSSFCNNYLNIQLDFLVKLYYKTNYNPIVRDYIIIMLKVTKEKRFWKIIRPIIVDKKLDSWIIKFNKIPKEYIDKKIYYLPSYYTRDDIVYTFKFLKIENIENYIEIHLKRIENFISTNFNILYKDYINRLYKKYNTRKDEILSKMKDKDIIRLQSPILRKIKISKVFIKNLHKKVLRMYLNFIDLGYIIF